MGEKKFSAEKKIEIIKAYKGGEVTYSQLKKVYGMNPNEIYRWVSKYEAHGEKAFRQGKGNCKYGKQLRQR